LSLQSIMYIDVAVLETDVEARPESSLGWLQMKVAGHGRGLVSREKGKCRPNIASDV
jgi:hypothetical protein